MNRKMMEKTRSMLSGVGLEQRFWAEAMATACYLINRSPTSALVGKTPMEVWSDEKEKKEEIVQLPPTPEKTEQKDHVGSNDEESSSSFDSLEEEQEQPKCQPLRRSMRV